MIEVLIVLALGIVIGVVVVKKLPDIKAKVEDEVADVEKPAPKPDDSVK